MKTIILALAIASLASCAFAQLLTNEPLQFKDGKVTLALKDAPIMLALGQLCSAAGKTYNLDPDAAELARKLPVTVRVENASFEDALTALTKAANLYWGIGDEGYMLHFDPMGHGPDPDKVQMLRPDFAGLPPQTLRFTPTPPVSTASHTVCLTLDAMPVKEAYDAVIKASGAPDSLGWRFQGDLGKKIMPGARFSNIPTNMAAAIVLSAAGLVPPTGSATAVATTGRVDFSAYAPSDILNGQWSSRYGQPDSVARYKGSDGVTRYFVNATMRVPELLRAIFPSNVSFVIQGEGSSKDATTASVRLMNVTLDEALRAILPSTGYRYYSTSRNMYTISKSASVRPSSQ